MKEQMIYLIVRVMAGAVVMVLHELPKTAVYFLESPGIGKKEKTRVLLRLHQYIDPIGLLFCAISGAGFSKPYMFRIRSKKTNFHVGLTGFLSLLIIGAGSLSVFRLLFYGREEFLAQGSSMGLTGVTAFALAYMFWYDLAGISTAFLLWNMVPLSITDAGLLIAGKSFPHYLSVIKSDYLIKLILLFVLMIGLFPQLSGLLLSLFL